MPNVALDPRIFDQIAELSRDEALEELAALVTLADAGFVSADVGTRARQMQGDLALIHCLCLRRQSLEATSVCRRCGGTGWTRLRDDEDA
jgi:hypothetical protein